MKSLGIFACALALSAFTLTQMSVPADARPRHKSMSRGKSNTGGRDASPSAAGGNASQPSRPGAQGSGGASGGGN